MGDYGGRYIAWPTPPPEPHRCTPPPWRPWRRIPTGAIWECDCGQRWDRKEHPVDWHVEWIRVEPKEPSDGDRW